MSDKYKQADGSKNCMQCAAAYMLGLPLADVPDFEQAGFRAWEEFYKFFTDRGFTAEMLPPTMEFDGDYLASGDTARGTSHMVVMRGGRLLHDPHPSNAGLKSVQTVWMIARKAAPNPGANARVMASAHELLTELVICRNDLARQAAELRQSVTVPGTNAIWDEEDKTLCEFEESRIARLDALIAKAKEEA